MTEANPHDGLQGLVTALAESMYNDPGETPVPMATTDATEVIKNQLTENTGTHFLDSGGSYGRHWEENQDNPPWEQPAWNVPGANPTHNVYHYMDGMFGRDRRAVALEALIYATGNADDNARDPWLRVTEDVFGALLDGEYIHPMLDDLGLPNEFAGDILGLQSEFGPGSDPYASHDASRGPMTVNTYNDGTHPLSQVLQGVNLGGPYAEYSAIQVHQGADVRGGYTGPRVYRTFDGWVPHELEFWCERHDWQDYESCLYREESLIFQRTVDPAALADDERVEVDPDGHPAIEAAYDDEQVDGAVFHVNDEGDIGYVQFR